MFYSSCLLLLITTTLQGCMNNISFGNDSVGYYETVAGGAGAGPAWNGRSGVHSHMTNTRITDPEILEKRSDIRVFIKNLKVLKSLLLFAERICCPCCPCVQIPRHFRAVLSEARLRRRREPLWWGWRGAETSVPQQRGPVCADRKTIDPAIRPRG